MGKPQKTSRLTIDPRKSKRIGYWDAVTSLALVFTALVTPAEVALVEPVAVFFDPLFLINRLVDVIFIFDILIQFLVMVEVQSHDASARGTIWLSRKSQIAKHYLKGWFFLDITSVLVSVFDFMGFREVQAFFGGDENAESLSKLKVLRVLRVLRLVKLLRLLRSSRILKRWEQRYAVNYAVMALFSATATVVLLAHWCSCVWVLQAKMHEDIRTTWLVHKGYCTPVLDGALGEHKCPGLEAYMASLYFSIMTITSIGYGDITPALDNWTEQFVASCVMMIASVMWVQMIGVFVGVISSFNPDRLQFRATMDERALPSACPSI